MARVLALLFLAFALIEIGGLAWLVRLDAATQQWLLAQRSCTLDYAMFVLQDRALTVLIVLGGVMFLWLCRGRRWREAGQLVLVVLIGSFLCELLKTGIERVRPSALPTLTIGNSFPSGHVTTACFVAGAIGFVLWQARRSAFSRVAICGLLLLLVGTVSWQRLYFGHHWLTDIVGSVLLASAWLSFALPHARGFAVTRPTLGVAALLLLSYLALYYYPGLRIVLPTAHLLDAAPVFTVTFGPQKQHSLFHEGWEADAQEGVGAVTWIARGEADLEVFLPHAGIYRLDLTLRPLLPVQAFACFPLDVTLNHQHLASLLLYRGWRQYTLALDAQRIMAGKNTLRFRVGQEFPEADDTRTVAFHQLRFSMDSQ